MHVIEVSYMDVAHAGFVVPSWNPRADTEEMVRDSRKPTSWTQRSIYLM